MPHWHPHNRPQPFLSPQKIKRSRSERQVNSVRACGTQTTQALELAEGNFDSDFSMMSGLAYVQQLIFLGGICVSQRCPMSTTYTWRIGRYDSQWKKHRARRSLDLRSKHLGNGLTDWLVMRFMKFISRLSVQPNMHVTWSATFNMIQTLFLLASITHI